MKDLLKQLIFFSESELANWVDSHLDTKEKEQKIRSCLENLFVSATVGVWLGAFGTLSFISVDYIHSVSFWDSE